MMETAKATNQGGTGPGGSGGGPNSGGPRSTTAPTQGNGARESNGTTTVGKPPISDKSVSKNSFINTAGVVYFKRFS